ncbi:MAG TPA: hypothetical protein VGD41_01085 [Pyrinomonadaceae bacterium]
MHLVVICDLDENLRAFVVQWRQFRNVMAQTLLALAVTGCATLAGSENLTKDSPVELKTAVVAKRAEARWRELIASNLAAAYEYLSPGTRSTMTYEQYKGKHRVGFYRAAKVDAVTCEAEVCVVKTMLTYDAKAIKGIITPVTEQWVIDRGQAWFVESP